jgi:hypothetical protein
MVTTFDCHVAESHRRVLMTRLARCVPLVLLAVGTRGLAEPAYPVSARVDLAPREMQHCLAVAGADKDDCGVIEHSHTAFAAVATRMFKPGAPPDLQLVLTVTEADVSGTAVGSRLNVRTRVRVLSAGGAVLDEIASDGRASVLADGAVDGAASAAAEDAAREFELSYARSQAIRDWLVANHVAPAAAVSIPERGDRLLFGSLGGGLVQGGGDSDVVPGPSVRIGGRFRRFVLNAMYWRYSSSYRGVIPSTNGTTAPAKLHVDDIGLELGASFQPTPTIELRAGPGLHLLSASGGIENRIGDETFVSSSAKVSPSAFASVSTTFLPFRSGARLFAGLEARAYFFSTVDMGASGRRVPAANTALGLVFGAEFPWGSGGRAP